MLKEIFGGKSWYQSLTGWGVLGLTVAWTVIPAIGEMGVISSETTTMLTGILTKISSLLGVLGIRKAAQAKNVA